MSNKKWKIDQIFVAFLEYLNFSIKCCFLQFCLKPRNRIYLPFLLSRASHTSILPCSAAKCNALRPSWSNTSTRPLLSKKIYSEYKNITHYLSYFSIISIFDGASCGQFGKWGCQIGVQSSAFVVKYINTPVVIQENLFRI